MEKILIETQALGELLAESEVVSPPRHRLVLLDARPRVSYLLSHIPGAIHVRWQNFSDPELPIPSLLDRNKERLEDKVGALGISQDCLVVVYADPFDCWGDEGRIYWMLSYLGHPRVQVLNGGWFKWKQESRPIERGPRTAKAVPFQASPRPGLIMTREELSLEISSPEHQKVIVDARTREEYLGTKSSRLPREGHIPGAVNIPWNQFYEADGTVKTPEAVCDIVGQSKVHRDQEVVAYCTGGVRSAWLYLVLKLAGFDHVKNYAGSWMEWSQDENLPIER